MYWEQCMEKTSAKRQVRVIVVAVAMGRCKRHNLDLNKPDFISSATDRCAYSPWMLFWIFHSECVCMSELRPVACHWKHLLPSMQWDQAEQQGWPQKRVQITKQQLLVPLTTAVLLRDFSISLKKMISKKRLFLVKLLGTLPMEKREKSMRNWKAILWWLQTWTVLSEWTWDNTEPCPGWLFVILCSPLPCIYSGAKSELLSNILSFYFCYPLSCPPKKRVTTQWRLLLTYARHLKT